MWANSLMAQCLLSTQHLPCDEVTGNMPSLQRHTKRSLKVIFPALCKRKYARIGHQAVRNIPFYSESYIYRLLLESMLQLPILGITITKMVIGGPGSGVDGRITIISSACWLMAVGGQSVRYTSMGEMELIAHRNFHASRL